MADRFEVGELAIIQNMVDYAEYNGTECEVVAPLALRYWPKARLNVECYGILAGSNVTACVTPDKLRKLPPPGLPGDPGQTVDWDVISGPKLIKLATT